MGSGETPTMSYESRPPLPQLLPSLVLAPQQPSQPAPQMPNAGSCVLRLEHVEEKSPAAKGELVHSIAEDICATFICIARHTEAGTLENAQTRVIDNVIKTIRDTDVERRIFLERKVRRLRMERRFLRREHAATVGQADALACGYRNKVQGLTHLLREARGEVVQLRGERDLLRACVKKEEINGGNKDGIENGQVGGVEGVGVDMGDEAIKDHGEMEGDGCQESLFENL
jgi:hypothetical protein